MGRNSPQLYTNQKFTRILTGIAFSSTLLASASAYSAELIDQLAAEVNGSAVTLSEVKQKVEKGPLIEVSPFPAQEKDPPQQVALNDLINKKLIMQKADELEIEVTDAQVTEEIDRFMKGRNLNKEQLTQALAEQGMTYEQYREDFKTQMVMNQFQGREILPQVKISDRDVQLYYLRHSGSAAENVRLVIRQLQISLSPDAVASVKEGKKSLVDKAFQELEGGMSFEQVVKIYSDNDEARKTGGLMSPLYVKDLAPLFQTAVKGLDEGKYSKPIETPVGYFIFYVEKKEFSGSEEYKKQRAQLEGALKQEEMGRLLGRWIEGQRKKSDIKILIKP